MLAVNRLAVNRLAVNRLAVNRFAVNRFAVNRFAVDMGSRSADKDAQSFPRDDKAVFAGEAANCGSVLSEPIMPVEKPTTLSTCGMLC